MSLSSTTDRVPYSGDAVTTAFSFPYKFFSNSDLVVIVKVNSTGVETTQTITTHYTVTGAGVEAGGTVTFLTPPASGTTVIIYRDKSAIQELDVNENGKIPSDNLEKQLDKLTMMVQRVKNKLARSVGLKEGFTASFDPSLPAIMVNDGYLKTTSAGTALEYVSEADLINTISTGSQAFIASRALVSDSNGLATQSATTSTEIGYVSGVTSAIQTQLNAKQDTITGAASTVVSSNLTANRAVISGAAGKLTTTIVTHTEIDYLSGVTSAIQTQLGTKVTNPMTTGGDIIYGGASGAPTRLANGTAGQVLQSNGTTLAPSWVSIPNSSVYLVNGNGYGSTNTKIRRFTNNTVVGTDITYADSATNGATLTINVAGVYAISRVDYYSLLSPDIGFSLNSSQLTTNIGSITAADRIAVIQAPSINGTPAFVGVTRYFAVNDVIRMHDNGLCNSTDVFSWVRIQRVD
jgi:hypothetical protein